MGADVECRRPHFNKSSFCLLGQNFWVGEELAGRRQRQDWVEGKYGGEGGEGRMGGDWGSGAAVQCRRPCGQGLLNRYCRRECAVVVSALIFADRRSFKGLQGFNKTLRCKVKSQF